MFCPNCRTEYKQGIVVCTDCGAKLVNELLPEADERELITVLETGDLAVVALAKSMLENAGIEYVAKGELPMVQLAVGPVEIQVDKDNEAEALELLESLAEGQDDDEEDEEDDDETDDEDDEPDEDK
jgi:hypothetical protein